MKTFNTAGTCFSSLHYMVDISEQVESAADLVRKGKYFCINRGRQYGKTTTLTLLKQKLETEGYAVFSLSFESIDDEAYKSVAKLADNKFVEENGRKIFLTYLRPIINGVGNYYCESRTRDMTRTDVIIDYLGQQYVIELKIWRGKSYNERGENQLAEYLDFYHLNNGYMVSFCFNDNKQVGLKEVNVGGRSILEAIV